MIGLACGGGQQAPERLFATLCDVLQRLAARQVRGENATRATSLVHEAWPKFAPQWCDGGNERGHVVAGGGVALIRAIASLAKLKGDNEEQNRSIQITHRAMDASLPEIVDHAGDEPCVILNKVAEGNYTYNATSGEYGDMIELDILDPTSAVARWNGRNASSASSTST